MDPSFGSSEHQPAWNEKRITKLVSILGEDWFKDKKVLDLACGHGENGEALMKLGAIVDFSDGRKEHVDFLINKGYNAFVLDQDKFWDLGKFYDLIVHWGVLYHLVHWREDLKYTLNHSNLICLESEVSDNENIEHEQKRDETGYDQALNGTGTLFVPELVEKELDNLGVKYKRYDDQDLDSPAGYYSWERKTRGDDRGRRFWIVRK